MDQARPAIVLASHAGRIDDRRLGEDRCSARARRLECQSGRPEVEIRVTAEQWTLRDGDETQVLQAVEGGMGLMPNGNPGPVGFPPPGTVLRQPVRMRIVRNRQISPPKTVLR